MRATEKSFANKFNRAAITIETSSFYGEVLIRKRADTSQDQGQNQNNITALKPTTPQQNSETLVLQQRGLITLGFNLGHLADDGFKGPKTIRALKEFRMLYGPLLKQDLNDEDALTSAILHFAQIAENDSRKYALASRIVAGVRLASLRTKAEFGFLMELAKLCSQFRTSFDKNGCVGLFAFEKNAWLDAIYHYGRNYGLDSYVDYIEKKPAQNGQIQYRVTSDGIARQIMDMRFMPLLSAVMAAERAQAHAKKIKSLKTLKVTRSKLGLAHMIGLHDMLFFADAANTKQRQITSDLFPEYIDVFPQMFANPRGVQYSLKDTRQWICHHFDTSRYEEHDKDKFLIFAENEILTKAKTDEKN